MTVALLFAACVTACGRPLMAPRDGGMDTGGPAGAGGGAAGHAIAGRSGAGGGAAGSSGGTTGAGGTGAPARCRCSDGRCCNPDQFCEIPTAACLSDGLPNGMCVSRPAGCYDEYQPVCGCDEITYANDCYRQRAGVPKRADGVCIDTCPPLPPAGACKIPGKICRYGFDSDPLCSVQATCDQTGRWALSPPVCP